METHNLVKELLKKGVMVTPDALEAAKKRGLENFLSENDGGACTVVHGTSTEKEKRTVKCMVKPRALPSEITPDDVVEANQHRYDALRKMLLRKTDAVSIGNAGKETSKITVVGMVSEPRGSGFFLEDTTGRIFVKSTEKASEDDVVGATGWIREGHLVADSVVYPDIPINRDIGTLDGTLLLTAEKGTPTKKADVVLTPDTISGQGSDRMVSNPAWVFLESGKGKVSVFVYRVKGTVDRNLAVSWLRKRYAGGQGTFNQWTDGVLETVPDIMWIISSNEPWSDNYKGVTIASFGEGHGSLIDLKTRKIEVW